MPDPARVTRTVTEDGEDESVTGIVFDVPEMMLVSSEKSVVPAEFKTATESMYSVEVSPESVSKTWDNFPDALTVDVDQ